MCTARQGEDGISQLDCCQYLPHVGRIIERVGKDGAEMHAVPKVEPRQGEAKTRYLGRQISLLGSALVMQSDSLDPTKDDILGNFHTQTL